MNLKKIKEGRRQKYQGDKTISEHKLYSGDEILSLSANLNTPLIDNLIWERDNIILVGRAGIGKSIFSQQIAFALSSGEPFLSEYPAKKSSVLYVQAEGRLAETKRRINNMLEATPWDSKNFHLIFYPGLTLNRPEGLNSLISLIDHNMLNCDMPKPKLIILDPLYMCMVGDLCEQKEASAMCRSMRVLTDRYESAIMLVHHEHRPRREEKTGNVIFEGSESIFGSFVWQAFADHIFGFSGMRGGGRELACFKQRSGDVISKIELDFIEPIPLGFELKGDNEPFIKMVLRVLKDTNGLSIEGIMTKADLPYNSVKRAIIKLRKADRISKVDSNYPTVWKLVKGEK